MKILSKVALFLLATFSCLSTHAVESWNKNTLYYGNYRSDVWTSSEFNGNMYRNFLGAYLYSGVWHSKGGWDTAIGTTFGIDKVDNVNNNYWVASRYKVWCSGSGDWWMGPKVSVNWNNCSNPDGCSGWWENYIIDRAKQSPSQIDSFIKSQGGWYLGESKPSGIHYKYYRRPFSKWQQLWAVRQYDPGTQQVWTPVKEILKKWRSYGLPNKRIDGIRINVETHGENYREFEFSDVSIPGSFW